MGIVRFYDFFKLLITEGGPGFTQIAVTNECNADCGFCNFARSKKLPKLHAPIERLLSAIEVLRLKRIRYIVYTGGETLLYEGLYEVLEKTRNSGIEPILVTNGQLLTEERVGRLYSSGVRNVIISIDSTDPSVHEKNRGLPGVIGRIKSATAQMRRLGMHPTASVTISKLVGDFNSLPGFIDGLGFKDLTFSYPLKELNSTYLSFSDSSLIDYSAEELSGIFETLKGLGPQAGVLNPKEGMEEMRRFLNGQPARFPCLAGYKYFFIDWNLDVYRCHYFNEKISAVEDLADAEPIRDGCAACMIDCYRDPSVLQFFAVSLSDSLKLLAKGRLNEAAGKIFDRRNLMSLKAVAEQFSLVKRYGGAKLS